MSGAPSSGSDRAVQAHDAARRIDGLFARYGESHRHPTNKAIHWICVPLITWSVLAFAWALSPALAVALVIAACAFYAWLSLAIALGMLAVLALMAYPLPRAGELLVPIAGAVFVLAWIGQFIGHRIEGRKPSFLDDVKFLLIGPAWLLAALYRRLGIPY